MKDSPMEKEYFRLRKLGWSETFSLRIALEKMRYKKVDEII